MSPTTLDRILHVSLLYLIYQQQVESYLRADKIIDVALSAKVQAIHPGFGFLSENADFADNCHENNINFIGPPSDAIRKMGSKSESKIIMTQANVPVVPGYHGEDQSDALLLEQAKSIGFPVLIKAIMGGGGKGMRIVRSADQFQEALDSARRESSKAFKDDRVLVEKYIEKPRHIEVQVFGDKHGNYLHFFERDCSIQRRHQKVIEEASSDLGIGDVAIQAARAVNYYNAGTVEFIFDMNSKQYYFMEMNTRLQVEHPVTEMITKTDLVELQFRVASGERLPSEVQKEGYAIEARIYSEQPQNEFLPGNGKLLYYEEPQNCRIDTGVRQGDEISIFYDPMIAKLIVWGKNRDIAIQELDLALQNYRIIGLPNNIHFLKQVVKNLEYRKWEYDTTFIDKHKQQLLELKKDYHSFDIASAVLSRIYQSTVPPAFRNFRNNYNYKSEFIVQAKSDQYAQPQSFTVIVEKTDQGYKVMVGEELILITDFKKVAENKFLVSSQKGSSVKTIFQNYIFDGEGDPIELIYLNEQIEDEGEVEKDTGNFLKAPMPCTLSKLNVKVGDEVKKGQLMVILEAMKMEHTIKAWKDGKVTEVRFKEGVFIDSGKTIVVLE